MSQELKLCIECKYHRNEGGHKCDRDLQEEPEINLVTGERDIYPISENAHDCSYERSVESREVYSSYGKRITCGSEGKYWERKQSDIERHTYEGPLEGSETHEA